jgi:hypothetical protein
MTTINNPAAPINAPRIESAGAILTINGAPVSRSTHPALAGVGTGGTIAHPTPPLPAPTK